MGLIIWKLKVVIGKIYCIYNNVKDELVKGCNICDRWRISIFFFLYINSFSKQQGEKMLVEERGIVMNF